ncbi:MAG: DNA starvation/stationary phase protection protein [Burkholderiales bacterium]|nr:DNA starvation/stationary phase protection protein [Burkholderiales bacterium]
MLQQQFFNIHDGISPENRTLVANSLAGLLADSYSLYLKTHNFHWNVTGIMFNSLHLMFEEHYMELAIAVDSIAERIRALGFIAPGSYSEFSGLTKIKEHTGEIDSQNMVQYLIESHEIVLKTAREVLPLAVTANDQVTMDLLTKRLQIHEKIGWMLRSLIQ